MDDTLPGGLLLISQPEQIGITPKEMVDALPAAYRDLPRLQVELDMADTAREAIRARDWGAAQRVLEEQFRTKIAPLRDKHPDYRVVYFGSAPIPLAVQLGFLLETWQQVAVVPHQHGRRTWGWGAEHSVSEPRLAPVHLPDFRDRSQGEAVIRVSTSHQVDAVMTRRAVPAPLLEVDISLEQPAEDVFTRQEEMRAVTLAFRRALDVIADQFPEVRRVHLFASVQPGMALLLGAQISKTMHLAVQTYQYARNAGSEPFHLPAMLINGPRRAEPLPLSEEDVSRAGIDRTLLKQDLQRMKGRALQERKGPPRNRFGGLLQESREAFSGAWMHLPALHETPLAETEVELDKRTVEDSFRLDPTSRRWQLDDHWLARLARRIPDDPRRQRALRLLVLHELAHRGPQALTSQSSKEIGRFPKVLEEIDYQADVWALVHEYVLTQAQSPTEVEDAQKFFKEMVLSATQTMWAFDDNGQPLVEIQIRRLNRYLIWYWQYLLLERGAGAGRETTLDVILATLAQRPLIELAGPIVLAHDERVFFALDTARVNVPELAIYHEGRLYRHGTRFDFAIDALLAGARSCDGDKMLDVLRAAFEQTVR